MNAKIIQVTKADPKILEYHLQDEMYLYLCFVYFKKNDEMTFNKTSPIKPSETFCFMEIK